MAAKRPDGGGDERLADGLGDGGEVGVAHLVDVVEGAHDPPDGAEEPDEGGRAGGGAEEGDGGARGAVTSEAAARLRARSTFSMPPSCSDMARVGGGLLLLGGDLGELDVAGAEDLGEGRAGERLGGLVDGVEPLALPEGLEELHRLVLGAPESQPLADDDGPADGRGREQDEEHREAHRPGVLGDLEVVEAVAGCGEGEGAMGQGEVHGFGHLSPILADRGLTGKKRAKGKILSKIATRLAAPAAAGALAGRLADPVFPTRTEGLPRLHIPGGVSPPVSSRVAPFGRMWRVMGCELR